MSKQIYKHSWPVAQSKASILIVHGLGEHIIRYQELANFFNGHGFSVHGFDHFGHGQSEGSRGHLSSYEDAYQQIDDLISNQKGDGPIFLYGHSLGGNVALNYILDRKPAIAGIISSAAFITMGKPTSSLLLFFGKIMSVIWPSLPIDNGLDLNNLSTDNSIIEAYKNDPLVHGKVSARLASNMIAQASRLEKYQGPLSAPLLIMHGEKDILTGPDGSKIFAANINSPVDLKIWENEFHEIHNGHRKSEVWNYTLDWLNKLLKTN